MFLDSRGSLVFLRNGSSYIISPFASFSSNGRTAFNETFSFLTFWKSGESRIRNLEQINLELLVKAGRTDALERENKILRQQLGVTSLVEHKMLPVRVLGRGRFLIVGAGSNEGVKVNQNVVYKNGLVGKVSKVTSKLTYVLLPTDPDSKIPVVVGPSEMVRGIVIGQFNSSIILDQIVQTEHISSNESIFTSGESEDYLQGLLIGKVGKTISQETDLFKKTSVVPVFDYNKLTTVFIVLD